MMPRFKKIKTERLEKFCQIVPRILAEHFLRTILGILLISVAVGGIVFYRFVIDVENEKVEAQEETLQFNEKIYNGLLEEWQKRSEISNSSEKENYADPFN